MIDDLASFVPPPPPLPGRVATSGTRAGADPHPAGPTGLFGDLLTSLLKLGELHQHLGSADQDGAAADSDENPGADGYLAAETFPHPIALHPRLAPATTADVPPDSPGAVPSIEPASGNLTPAVPAATADTVSGSSAETARRSVPHLPERPPPSANAAAPSSAGRITGNPAPAPRDPAPRDPALRDLAPRDRAGSASITPTESARPATQTETGATMAGSRPLPATVHPTPGGAPDGARPPDPVPINPSPVGEAPPPAAPTPAAGVAVPDPVDTGATRGGIAARVAAVVEAQTGQPLPRSFLIEISALDGAQVRVAIHQDGTVRLTAAGDDAERLAPFLTTARDALSDRGFDLAGDPRRREGRQPEADQDRRLPTARRVRPAAETTERHIIRI